jgi:hypothetical protein
MNLYITTFKQQYEASQAGAIGVFIALISNGSQIYLKNVYGNTAL